MENLLVLLLGFGVLAAVIVLLRRASARRGLIKPSMLEKPPMTDRAAAAPAQPPTIDVAITVAIASAVNAVTPGARVIRIEEEL
jgi:hypothetical protein